MASKEAKQVFDHVSEFLGPEVRDRFGLTLELFDKKLDECVGPAIDRQAAAEIMIKMFDIQWKNLKV